MNQLQKNRAATNGLMRRVIADNEDANIIFEVNRDEQMDRYMVLKPDNTVESYDILRGINTRNRIDVYPGLNNLKSREADSVRDKYERLKTRFVLTVAVGSVIVLGLITALVYAYQS